MTNIKKYWKEILIGLLIVFSMNKCTVACNRSTKINKQETELVQKDSVIRVQADSLNIFKIRWDDAQKSQSTYQGIALGNQTNLIQEVESLNNTINAYKDQVNVLKNQNNKLKDENNKLRQQISK